MNKRIVLLFTFVTLFCFISKQLNACHEATVDLVSCTENNGVFTYVLDICLEFNGLEGAPEDFNMTFVGALDIDSFSPAMISTSSGDPYPGTTSGNVLTYETTSIFVAHSGLLCEQYTITTSEAVSSIIVEVHPGRSEPECTRTIAINKSLLVQPKVFLQGPLSGSLMNDDLRPAPSLIPTMEPYGTGNGENFNASILMVTGNDAIVDWVLVELRDATTPSMIVATRAALVQRDGDVVDTDGISAVAFSGISAGSYHVAIRHRNHLSVMTDMPMTLN